MIVGQGRGETRTRVFAFSGWGVGEAMGRAKWAGQRYRQRFGVETSYRQTNQGRGWTTGVSVAYRLLLEGLAPLVRQAWVNRTGVIAAARGLGEKAWVSELPLWLKLVGCVRSSTLNLQKRSKYGWGQQMRHR